LELSSLLGGFALAFFFDEVIIRLGTLDPPIQL
jgi:hypothetical protein